MNVQTFANAYLNSVEKTTIFRLEALFIWKKVRWLAKTVRIHAANRLRGAERSSEIVIR
jgi:hypothetical protein